MTSIFDVAAYVLDKLGVMTTMKLEKALLLFTGMVPRMG